MIPNGGQYDSQYAFRITHPFEPDWGKAWRADGSFSSDKGKVDDADLIAEWVEDAPVKAIVCLIEGGQPKPATHPHVHPSREAATKEAKRLADVHVGQEFGVYILADSVITKPDYAHEWQRLAKSGNKINAIRELRSLASLDLASAKKAVETFIEKEPFFSRAA